MQHREAKVMNNDLLLLATYVDPKYRITSNKEQLETGRRTLVNIAIDMQNFSKINETCENTPFLLSVSKTLSTASLSDDELDLESHWICRLRGSDLKEIFQMNQILMLLSEKVLKRH